MTTKPKILAVAIACLSLAGCNGIGGVELTAGAPAASADALWIKGGNTPPVDHAPEAKEAFRAGNYGQSVDLFRQAVESQSDNAEAWLGLAASYDQLGRFDLADRAYDQVVKLIGATVVVHNNRGYSYLMRGDKNRARREFLAARAMEPHNLFVINNLKMMDGNLAR